MKAKNISSMVIRILVSAALMFLLFYSMLPAVNLRDKNFLVFLILCILIFLVVNFLSYTKDFLQTLGSGRGVQMVKDEETGQFGFPQKQRKKKRRQPWKAFKIRLYRYRPDHYSHDCRFSSGTPVFQRHPLPGSDYH